MSPAPNEVVANIELITGRDDLGVNDSSLTGELLARVDEVGILEQQQLLNVISLQKLSEKCQELFLLVGRQTRPMSAARFAPISSVSRNLPNKDERTATFSLWVRLLATIVGACRSIARV